MGRMEAKEEKLGTTAAPRMEVSPALRTEASPAPRMEASPAPKEQKITILLVILERQKYLRQLLTRHPTMIRIKTTQWLLRCLQKMHYLDSPLLLRVRVS